MAVPSNGKRRVHNGALSTAAASSTKGQLEASHYRGQGAGQQRGGLSDSRFKGIWSKNATEGGSLCTLNHDEDKPIVSLLLRSSNLSRTVLQPSILHCQPFKKLAKWCCCVVLAHHVQSLPSPQPWTAQALHSTLPTNPPTPTGFPLYFSFCFLHIHPIFVFPFLTKTGFQLMFAFRMVYPPQCGARQGHGPHFLP